MGRITLEFAEDSFTWATELVVRSTDINEAGHTSNDALVSLISDARMLFFRHLGLLGDGSSGAGGLIIADFALVYQAESYRWDTLRFDLGLADFNKYGADVVIRVTRPADGTAIAKAKSGFVFFDYTAGTVTTPPPGFPVPAA